MTKYSKSDRDESVARLRELLKPGDTVYTILRHVSRSGLSRDISLMIRDPRDGEMLNISFHAARAMNDPLTRDTMAIKIGGAGMDMGFALVYNLSATLFRDDFVCTGERCPSNDHSNGDRDYSPHRHSDGGYALSHRWLSEGAP